MKIMMRVLFITLILHSNLVDCQTVMSPQQAFYFGMRLNYLGPYDRLTYANRTYQWVDLYASFFDKQKYIMAVNDEFQRKQYLTNTGTVMTKGIDAIDFNSTFYFLVEMSLDSYDTECGCFPVLQPNNFINYHHKLLAVKEVGKESLWFDIPLASFSIGHYLNFNDFDFALKMNALDAQKFVASRKNTAGSINRNIILKVTYNVTSKRAQNNNYQYYVDVYMRKIEFYDNTHLLGSIYPKVDYYDKVNLVKIRDGEERIYFDKDWKILATKDSGNASFYRVKKYKDGQQDYLQMGYFINGTKQMKGHFDEDDKRNGKFTWYDERGNVIQQSTFINDKAEGSFTEYYPNGTKERQRYYYLGKKYGCEYRWDQNGKLTSDEYYIDKNGATNYSKRCNVSRKILTADDNIMLGHWKGINKIANETIDINSDKICTFHEGAESYSGKAGLKVIDTLNKMLPFELDEQCLTIENIVGRKITPYNSGLFLTLNGSIHPERYLWIFTDGNNIYAWAGHDTYFQKE